MFRRTGKVVFVFSSAAGDQNLDGVQTTVLHRKAELFVDFRETVLLEAIAHIGASVRDGHIAMLNPGYLGTLVHPSGGLETTAEATGRRRMAAEHLI